MFGFRQVLSCAALRGAFVLAVISAATPAALAQTTKTLTVAKDSTIRGGSYASKNYGDDAVLETRASDDASYDRRAVLTFDTDTTMPANSTIQSAKLTLTVGSGSNSESRRLSAYVIPISFDEGAVNWKVRKSSAAWTYAGGDVASLAPATATVSGSSGSTVTFDVTAAVQKVVTGAYGSRYSRFLVMDEGGTSRGSYKSFHSGQSSDSGKRPKLTVTYGGTTTSAPAPSTTTTTGKQLRVLQWNVHHGVGTDGKYDIDRIATWIAKMKPDVVTLNEVEKYTGWGNEDQPARYKSLLQAKTGKTWYASFTQEFGDWSSKGKGHLILSVYPFDSTGHDSLTASSGLNGAGAVGQAGIVVNGRTINIIVSHLDPSSQSMRLTQAKETISFALGFAENRIVTGDMNAWPDQSSIAELNKTYYDSWAVAESKGTAYQFSGLSPNGATKKGRIDYIFYSRKAGNLVLKSSQVYDTRNSSGVMPSDHRPVLSTFEVR
ncbi:MAG TPA: DNRLRE domain-containing protein [Vicinamibacterales bacterium]